MRNYKNFVYGGISAVYLVTLFALYHLIRLAYFLFFL